jgi:hypothetical protein
MPRTIVVHFSWSCSGSRNGLPERSSGGIGRPHGFHYPFRRYDHWLVAQGLARSGGAPGHPFEQFLARVADADRGEGVREADALGECQYRERDSVVRSVSKRSSMHSTAESLLRPHSTPLLRYSPVLPRRLTRRRRPWTKALSYVTRCGNMPLGS